MAKYTKCPKCGKKGWHWDKRFKVFAHQKRCKYCHHMENK